MVAVDRKWHTILCPKLKFYKAVTIFFSPPLCLLKRAILFHRCECREQKIIFAHTDSFSHWLCNAMRCDGSKFRWLFILSDALSADHDMHSHIASVDFIFVALRIENVCFFSFRFLFFLPEIENAYYLNG